MKNPEKTREQFTGERAQAHQRIAELEELLNDGKGAEQAIQEAREYAESIVATSSSSGLSWWSMVPATIG